MFTILTLIDFCILICLFGQYWFEFFETKTLIIIFCIFFFKASFFTLANKDFLSIIDMVVSIFIFTIFFITDYGLFFWISFIYLIYKMIICFWVI
jgi:hypothetical protein